jgi:hypothetical protein
MPVGHPKFVSGLLNGTQAIHRQKQGYFASSRYDFTFVFNPELCSDLHKTSSGKNCAYNMLRKAYCQDKPFKERSRPIETPGIQSLHAYKNQIRKPQIRMGNTLSTPRSRL